MQAWLKSLISLKPTGLQVLKLAEENLPPVLQKFKKRVYQRVLQGMGLVVLHSGHFSKIFRKLMGTTCNLKWREDPNEREILWVTRPGHPIVQGIDDHFILEHTEMYGEHFDVPEPEETVFISSFARARKNGGSAKTSRSYVSEIAKSFPTPAVRRQVYSVLEDSLMSDQKMSGKESELLLIVSEEFKL